MKKKFLIALLCIIVALLLIPTSWCLYRAYGAPNIRSKEHIQCKLLKEFLIHEAKETYGAEWAEHKLVKEISVQEHKWYEVKPEEWVYIVTYYTSDGIEYFKNAPPEMQTKEYPVFIRVEE